MERRWPCREATIGIILPQAYQKQKLQGWVGGYHPLEALGRVWSSQHHDFRILASRTVREDISIVWSHPVCSSLENYGSPRELIEAPVYRLQFLCLSASQETPYFHQSTLGLSMLLVLQAPLLSVVVSTSVSRCSCLIPPCRCLSHLRFSNSCLPCDLTYFMDSRILITFAVCLWFFFFSVETVLFPDPHILKQKPEGMNLKFCWFSSLSSIYFLI